MSSRFDSYLCTAPMLAALVLCAFGALTTDTTTENPAGEPSGEEDIRSTDLPGLPLWNLVFKAAKNHKEDFEGEFHVPYDFLENYKMPFLPESCPSSNFSKEACLHRMVHGISIYQCLLKHLDKELPSSLILSDIRYYSSELIRQIIKRMKNPQQITMLPCSQEEHLQKELDNASLFHRRMMAHSILRQIPIFLIKGKREVTKREMSKGIPRRMVSLSSCLVKKREEKSLIKKVICAA